MAVAVLAWEVLGMWRRLFSWLRSLPGRLFWWAVPGLKEQYMGGFGGCADHEAYPIEDDE